MGVHTYLICVIWHVCSLHWPKRKLLTPISSPKRNPNLTIWIWHYQLQFAVIRGEFISYKYLTENKMFGQILTIRNVFRFLRTEFLKYSQFIKIINGWQPWVQDEPLGFSSLLIGLWKSYKQKTVSSFQFIVKHLENYEWLYNNTWLTGEQPADHQYQSNLLSQPNLLLSNWRTFLVQISQRWYNDLDNFER